MQKLVCYCTIFALFYFEFEGNFQVQVPGGLYLDRRFNGGFFALRGLGGCIYGGAYFRNFTVCQKLPTVIENLQWNLDIDIKKAKGTGKYVRYTEDFLIWRFVISRFHGRLQKT